MKKNRYLSPSVRLITGLETECQILQTSNVRAKMTVRPLQESFWDGTETDEGNYLIEF